MSMGGGGVIAISQLNHINKHQQVFNNTWLHIDDMWMMIVIFHLTLR